MANQRVIMVQNDVFSHVSLREKSARQYRSAGRSPLAQVVDHVHPRTGQHTKFMLLGGDILELQVARPREPLELGSFFIGQAVQEDAAIHVASRVDPLFLALPALTKHATLWCPVNQALVEGGSGALRTLNHFDVEKICDVNDRLGPDEILIRLNEDRVITWLMAKVNRATQRFVKAANGATGASSGSKTGGCIATDLPQIEIGEGDEHHCRQQALEAVSEYLSEDWGEKLAQKFGMGRSHFFGGKSAATNKRKAAWDGPTEEERNLALSHGRNVSSKTQGDTAAPVKTKKTITQAQRSLSKVNKKGMKNIASFFGK